MSFLSKVELKKQLRNLGIRVEGNYVRKRDIRKVLANSIDFDAPARVKATVLSVILPEGKGNGMPKSVSIGVEVQNKGGEKDYSNLTLRFDQGGAATLRGYPNEWAIWDENTDAYDQDSMTYEEYLEEFNEGMEKLDKVVYVSKETEKEIIKQIKTDIEKQFGEKEYKNNLTEENKKKVRKMMDNAIVAKVVVAAKICSGSDSKFNYIYCLEGVTPDFWQQPFGRQLSDLKLIKDFTKAAKVDHIDAKGKSTLKSVKEWVAANKPEQYFAKWQKDSSNYKDDSVEIYYK